MQCLLEGGTGMSYERYKEWCKALPDDELASEEVKVRTARNKARTMKVYEAWNKMYQTVLTLRAARR